MMKRLYVHREIEKVLINTSKQFPCTALTGPRQSGKSTLLKNIFGKTHAIVSFDDPLIRQQAITDPKLFIENIKEPVIFDEVQYVPELLSYLKIKIDEKRHKKNRYIITGSQQFNLIKNLGDTLAGRIGLLSLLPFSKKEKSSIKRLKIKSTKDAFIDACLRGAYPEINVFPKINFETWYGSYLQTYLERDIRTIYDIGSLREFQKFIQLLAARCSQILNLSDLSKELGVSINTLKKWISILEASQIIYLLSPYYRSLKKRITKSPKLYFLDCGFICYLCGIRDKRYLINGPMAGALFENYVIQETLKSFLNFGRRPNIFYVRTHNNVEVDLIIEKNMQIFPVEIKSTKSPTIQMAKSIEQYQNTFSKLNIAKGKIISMCDEKILLTRNVSLEPLENFLDWIKSL